MFAVRWLASAAFVMCVAAAPAAAQEFRIYTRVMLAPEQGTDPSVPDAARPDVVSRSLTLFHAGRVYDFIDALGEVIILEPGRKRFTVLNTKRDFMTTVEFDELTNLLKVGSRETANYVARLEEEDAESSAATIALIRFQLEPQFDETYETGRLTLSSRHIRYDVECTSDAGPEVSDAWAAYADAMCRLNFVLHPGMMLPGPRLALNTSLAQRKLIPTAVNLKIEGRTPVQLRAEHQIAWELDARDRSLIHHWESVLKRKTTKSLTFHEYQRQAASAVASRKK